MGCSKAPQPQAATVIPSDGTAAPNFDAFLGDSFTHHGSAARSDYGTGFEVRLDAIALTAPTTWKRTTPGSSYYLAEFALPHVAKDMTDGRLMVSVGSGSIESNLGVFKGEFDADTENAKQEQKEIAGIKMTFMDVAGAYNGRHGQSGATSIQQDYRMIVAVIPIGDQLHFIKAVGPQQTIAANVEAIDTFVSSVRRRSAEVEISEAASSTGTEVRLKPLTFTAPATWKRTKPRSSLVQAEFAIPHSDKGTTDGRLTVSVVAGTVQDNVDRWKGQFVGTIERPKQEKIEVAGFKATLVDFAGTFGEQAGMTAPVVNRPDYRMLAAIIPIGEQLYVVKAVGPQQTIIANVEGIHSFLGSVKRDE